MLWDPQLISMRPGEELNQLEVGLHAFDFSSVLMASLWNIWVEWSLKVLDQRSLVVISYHLTWLMARLNSSLFKAGPFTLRNSLSHLASAICVTSLTSSFQ